VTPLKKTFVVALALVLAGHSWAANKTVTLSVPGMYCATCPITVKKALSRVPGVNKIVVNLEKRQAIVSFDDAKADVEALTWATQEAGYPSQPLGNAQ